MPGYCKLSFYIQRDMIIFMARKKVFCFGNELLKEDRLALEVGRKLQSTLSGFEFVPARAPETLLDYAREKIILVLDVVRGIEKVRFVEVRELQGRGIVSGHDYDLGMFLQLSGLKNVRIIGIPMGMRLEKAMEEAKHLLLENEL